MKKNLLRLTTLCLLLALAVVGRAGTITATWDFRSNADPRATTLLQNTTGTLASNVDGVELTIDATNGKFDSQTRTNDAHIPATTIIKVPVKSTKDVVTIVGNWKVSYTIGSKAEAVTDLNKTYTATAEDVKAGSVTITSTDNNNYFYSISVVLNDPEEPVAQDVTATWDYSNETVMSETMALTAPATTGTVKAIEDNGILLTVEANGASFRNNGNNIQVGSGAVFKVPVKNAGDLVVVKGYPNFASYTVGNITVESLNGNGATPDATYKAKASDVEKGYITITSNINNNYFYSISVTQYAPKEATTLDNEEAGATFPFNLGTAGQKATFSKEDYRIGSKVELGSNMGYAATRTLDEVTFTKIQPQTAAASAAADDYVLFRIQPKFGFTFTPTAVSLKAYKDGTDNGQLTIKWVTSDGTETELAKEVAIARNSETPAFSSLSYNDFSRVTAKEGYCALKVYIGGNLATTKQIGLADIIIEGKLSGTEKEVPVLGSFKINDTEYSVDNIFGDQYEAELKLSKKEAMVSSTNPLTATATSGEIGTITYEGTETSCKVTIPMTMGTTALNYVLNVTQKPDYTLTYYGVDGVALENTQTVEEDSKIGEFIYDIANIPSQQNGYKARGWFKNNYVGAKYSVNDVVTSNLNLYAVETEIEVASLSRKYEFDLTDKNFDAADHEGFNPTGGTPNVSDMRHGWNFKENNTIDLLVGPKASIIITTCMYPQGGTTQITASNGKSVAAISEADGGTQSIEYEGEGGTLTLTISGGQCYIHNIKILNTSETNYEKNGSWIYVKPNDASSLLDAIDAANAMTGTDRVFIYVPNGTYDLKQTTLTTIGRNNVSLIGESMEGTIIKNRPVKEGIAITATLLNTATNTYLQDLTLDCIAPYGTGDDTKSAERGVCFQDKGNQTIMKDVYLKGLQDTYYSNNNSGTYYFEGGKIEGSVDYVCGNGDVYFNKVEFYTVNKSAAAGSAAGGVIAAPNTKKSFGYIFNECTLNGMSNEDGKYRLGRPWAANTIVRMLDSKMMIKPTAAGWGEWSPANAVEQFAEYNSVDKDGNAIDLTQRANTIGGQTNNPVITEAEAANYRPDAIFADSWKPATLAAQLDAPTATLAEGKISWTAVNGAAGYAIFADDDLLTIVGADVTSYTIEASAPRRAASNTVYTIRTINAMGGMGVAGTVTSTDGINEAKMSAEKLNDGAIYTLQGVRVDKATKGIYIINGKKVVVK